MSTTLGIQYPDAYIKRRTPDTVIVECPFCGEEHEHLSPGTATAYCGMGTYIVVERLKK